MLNKFQSVISKIVLVCVAIFTSVVFVQMAIYFGKSELTYEPVLNILVLICAIILVLLAALVLIRISDADPIKNRLILFSLISVFAIVAIIWIKLVPQTQVSDFSAFWSNTPGALNGKSIYHMDNDYFAKWAYQTGFLVYVMAVVKIFGHHIIAIQLLNVLYQALILLVMYQLVVKIFNNVKMARLSVLLLMIDLDWFALNSQTNNQYLGMLLFLVTFYLIMLNKYWSFGLAGLTLGFGSIIRPIGPVVIAGIVVFAIVYFLLNNNKFHIDGVWKLLFTLAIYFVIFSGASMAIKSSGLNEYGLSNRDSEWKFVIGLDYNSRGVYDQAMVDRFNLKDTRDTMSKKEYSVIHENINYLNSNHKWISLLWSKNSTLWAQNSTATDFTGFDKIHSAKATGLMRKMAYMGTVILIIFSWIGSLQLFKIKFSNNIYLLLLTLMAYAVVQLFIEVQGRYRLEFIPVIAILGSVGLYTVVKLISQRWRGNQTHNV
ncbi:glycosyltransferase family protein [Companilactobacillus jidongensis]|uniref:glycosyltransferase family 39 protein n=1 Tax=Companilactobacillus jidongensis TaxID=2486006 RepID=UPI000F788116|nr:glycosyltransferase family 39 protein [Companilactobacillus jidongensis]